VKRHIGVVAARRRSFANALIKRAHLFVLLIVDDTRHLLAAVVGASKETGPTPAARETLLLRDALLENGMCAWS
jgi:hypothetical protein